MKEGFLRLFSESLDTEESEQIKGWVQEYLMSASSQISVEKKKAFFESEKELLAGYLKSGKIDKFQKLLEVFYEFNNTNSRFKKLEFKVFVDAIRSSKQFILDNKDQDSKSEYRNIFQKNLDFFQEYKNSTDGDIKERFEEVNNLLIDLSSTLLGDEAGLSTGS
jgi:RNA recognition motif-containing protein